MKKGLFLLCLCFLGIQVLNAQKATYHYAKIYSQPNLNNKRISVCIDFGQSRKASNDNRIRADSGELQKFNSMIDALNYMAEEGWEFVQAYSPAPNYYHYLIRKIVPAEKEADFFPKIKTDF